MLSQKNLSVDPAFRILFSAGICSSGSLNGVILGSHYNRKLDSPRIVLREFREVTLDDSSISDIIKGLLEDRKANKEDITNIEFDSRVLLFLQTFKQFRDRVREGNYGKTVQFRLLLRCHGWSTFASHGYSGKQFLLQVARIEKDASILLCTGETILCTLWITICPSLGNLDAAQSGCRDLIQEKGLSVQGQDRYPARIPIAQRGSRQLIEIKNLQEESSFLLQMKVQF